MQAKITTFLLATAVLVVAASQAPARAEATAGEVLGWCDGASQPGQLGTINALRCVNYLQGAAEMVQALNGTDVGACLDGSQSLGTQLMARFVPQLRESAGSGRNEPVARQVAQWLESECATVTAAAAPEPEAEALQAQLDAALEALDAARQEAQSAVGEAARLRTALSQAGDDEEALGACTASMDQLRTDLDTAEAAAAENAMRVSELELELEAADAEAMARRQEIASSSDRITALSDQFDAALGAKQREIEALERRVAGLADSLDDALSQRAEAVLALSEAREGLTRLADAPAAPQPARDGLTERLQVAEAALDESNEQIAALQAALENSRGHARQLEDELRTALEASVERATALSSLENDLAACSAAATRTASIPTVPPPAPTPPRDPAPPPVIAEAPSAPSPTFNRLDVPRTGGNISNGIARIPGSGGANVAIVAQPRELDTLGLMTLRQTQQLALHQNAVDQRREWQSPNGFFTGFVEILREGYQSGDFCREILSVARSGGAEVHRATERYCRAGNMWVFRR